MADAALSKKISAMPSRKDIAASAAMATEPNATRAAKPPTSTARSTSVRHISRRRSVRSTTAPPIRPNSSQGRKPAIDTTATAVGLRVMLAAISGNATPRTPSPRLDPVVANQASQNGRPRPARSTRTTGHSAGLTVPDRARGASQPRR